METGDYQKAIADLSKAIALNPLDSLAFRVRAAAWLILREHEKAESDLGQHLQLSPHEAEAYRERAGIRALLGNTKQAAEDMRTAERIEAEERRK